MKLPEGRQVTVALAILGAGAVLLARPGLLHLKLHDDIIAIVIIAFYPLE